MPDISESPPVFLGNELSEMILGLGYKGLFMVLAEHINAIPITLKSFLFTFFLLAYIEIKRGIYDSQRNCPATLNKIFFKYL